ncbi:MAG: o-succinylbenzoate synthase [Anaerolineae bacterium]|nr:o-succinylbenzoate synthase [Anaerolineae bacterium]MDW8171409.1 o-succinylbenzoate synthase [Anaerolineae bacterium]
MQPITIQAVHLHPVALPLVEPLRTSFGVEPFKSAILCEVVTKEGVIGWGESAVAPAPGYAGETMATAYHLLKHFLAPLLINKTLSSPYDARPILAFIRDNKHARAGLEMAVWDAFAKANGLRLADLFAHYLGQPSTNRAVVGVSIGIQPSVEDTLKIIRKRLDQGYKRIKLKIEPGWDIELARGVRAVLPDTMLMLDANSAYRLEDADHLAQLDAFNLIMIEQPLAHDDIYEHSKLQPRLKTPICLDESVKSANDLRLALELGAIGVLNLKPARVGGFAESLDMMAICAERALPLWIGGMLETGIGRAANVALASLPPVTLPCDISATDRYFAQDITEPPFVLQADSTLSVPDGLGIGVEVQRERLEAAVALWQAEADYPLG